MQGYLIGKVSKMLNLSTDTLRYYDRIGIVKPKKSKENGYRYYSIQDIYYLTDIMFYRKIGVPLKDINKLTNNGNIDSVINLLESKETKINNEIKKLQDRMKKIKTMKNLSMDAKKFEGKILKRTLQEHIFKTINIYNDFSNEVSLEKLTDENSKWFNSSYFSFLINSSMENVIYGMSIAKNENSSYFLGCDECRSVTKKLCIYTVVSHSDDMDYSFIKKVKNIVNNNNLNVSEQIFGRLIASSYKEKKIKDYYEIWIPIEK